jgi:hypothetical protein
MRRLEVSCAVRHVYAVRRRRVKTSHRLATVSTLLIVRVNVNFIEITKFVLK